LTLWSRLLTVFGWLGLPGTFGLDGRVRSGDSVQAFARQILKCRLHAPPGFGGALGAAFHANALVNGSLFGSLRTVDYEELAREFDDGCVLMHADLPVADD